MSATEIITTIARAAPTIRNGLPGRRYLTDAENPSGEDQLAADVWADQVLADRLTALESVGAYASEERDDVVSRGDGYAVTVDPLDGSSNLKSNNSMGTILGVYDESLPASGRSLIASAYVLFGPITTMMVAHNDAVTEYVIDDSGERHLATENVTLPDEPTVYGFGGRVPDWTDTFSNFAQAIEQELKLRYGGAFIGDVNQVITYGGIFAYPELQSRETGKLRLQFEANPIAHIIETAGGRSSDGAQSLLDVEPESLHQRTPVYVGNASLIERRESL